MKRMSRWIALVVLLAGSAFAQTVNTDSALTLGNSVEDTATTVGTSSNPFVLETSNTSVHLWQILANPWGVTSRTTGSTTIDYTGSGSLVTTVNYTGVNLAAGVNGYPLIVYGGDIFGDTPINTQGPTFPVQISSLSALTADVSYTLSLTSAPTNLDVGFDQWIMPTSGYSGGASGALEVFIAPYYNFSGACSGGGGTFVTNFSVNITQNGTPGLQTWKEYAFGTGPGNEVIFCPSGTQISSGEVRFNMLDFLNQAISTNGGGTVNTAWYDAGINFGTEWGDSTSPNYTLTTTKLDIEQAAGPNGSSLSGARLSGGSLH